MWDWIDSLPEAYKLWRLDNPPPTDDQFYPIEQVYTWELLAFERWKDHLRTLDEMSHHDGY